MKCLLVQKSLYLNNNRLVTDYQIECMTSTENSKQGWILVVDMDILANI